MPGLTIPGYGGAALVGGGIPKQPQPATGQIITDPIKSTTKESKEKKKPFIMPIQYTMGEPEIYGPVIKCTFSLQYQVVGTDLKGMLLGSGLWRPAPDGNWGKWAYALGNTIDPRGTAQLAFDPGEDRIIDLCGPKLVDSELTQVPNVGLGGAPSMNDLRSAFPEPTPDASWITYTNMIRMEVSDNTVAVATLPKDPIPATTGLLSTNDLQSAGAKGSGAGVAWFIGMGGGRTGTNSAAFGGYALPTNSDGTAFGRWIRSQGVPSIPPGGSIQTETIKDETSTTVHKRKPQAYLYMTGHAMRVRYDIPCPILTNVNGVVPVPANRVDRGEGFWSGVVGNNGWPVVGARWNLRYFLADLPKGPLPTLPNPLDGSTG